jgi:hypothetical protein
MRIQTPHRFHHLGYFGLDTSALRRRADDEFLAFGIGRLYFGIYPNRDGFQVAYGIVDQNGSL